MKASQVGRVTNHSKGLGTVTRATVMQRARELAVINGREANHVIESDWRQARLELLGHDNALARDEDPRVGVTARQWEVAGSAGHQAPIQSASDEQTVAERLTEEGAAEAEHDSMFQASRDAQSEDRDNEK